MNLEDLKKIKESDLVANRLTYIVPSKNLGEYIRDELMWVRRFENDVTVVFRTADGKEHFIEELKLKSFHLVGR